MTRFGTLADSASLTEMLPPRVPIPAIGPHTGHEKLTSTGEICIMRVYTLLAWTLPQRAESNGLGTYGHTSSSQS